MSSETPKKAPIPPWAWPFAIVCFAIPVVAIGGAIPTGLGIAGGLYCLAVARRLEKTEKHRVIHCVAATAICWSLFAALAVGVATLRTKSRASSSSHAQARDGMPSELTSVSAGASEQDVLADEDSRREIYAMAVRMREPLERAEARKVERRRRGLDVGISDKQIDHIERMHENHLDFATRFYKITREELDAVIVEGDRKRWPMN